MPVISHAVTNGDAATALPSVADMGPPINVSERLAASINGLEAARYLLNGPWGWEASHRGSYLLLANISSMTGNAISGVGREKDVVN